MKVKIVKSINQLSWYDDKIGEVFEVESKLNHYRGRWYYCLKGMSFFGSAIHKEECEVIEEKEQKMTPKQMLKNGMVVEYAHSGDGVKYAVVIGDMFLSDTGYLPISQYDDYLNISTSWSIFAIYDVPKKLTSLSQYHLGLYVKITTPIWKREDAKEIPVNEAMNILEKHYGTKVKLINDK